MMDTLIAEKRLPHNLVALFVSSGGSDAQGSQRGLEYDTMDGVFAEFVETEVIPFVSAECGISLTSDPEGRGAMGGSSGPFVIDGWPEDGPGVEELADAGVELTVAIPVHFAEELKF